MNTTIQKKGISLLLAVVMCLASFLGIGATTAYAMYRATVLSKPYRPKTAVKFRSITSCPEFSP